MDSITNENNKEHNEKWPFIPDHPYRILIIGGFGSGKTNALLNLIKEQCDIDKIHLYPKDLKEPSMNFLSKSAKMLEQTFNDPNAFVQIEWMTCIRLLMNTIQGEKEKF